MQRQNDIQTLRWGIQALRLLGDRGEMSCGELVLALGISRPAAYRIVGTLQTLGHVARVGGLRSGRYRLAPGVRALSDGLGADRLLFDVAPALLLEFTRTQGWPLALGIPVGDRCFIGFATDHATSRVLTRRRAGQFEPYPASALGQVCLAGLAEPLRASRYDRLAAAGEAGGSSFGVPVAVLGTLARRVREQRYALHDTPDARELDLAIPVQHRGRFVAALGLRYMRVASGGHAGHRARLDWLSGLAAALEKRLAGSEPRHDLRKLA